MTTGSLARAILAGGLVAILAGGLTACASGGAATDQPRSVAQGTQRVVINYLIAHGMAESYVMSGRATPADLVKLVDFDRNALIAIRGHEANPDWTTLSRAAGAVSALMDYTTRMDDAAGPPASPRAASR